MIKGVFLFKLETQTKAWSLTFEMKPQNVSINDATSVLHFTTGEDIKKYGNRNPAFWYLNSLQIPRLQFRCSINGIVDSGSNLYNIPLDEYTKIHVHQRHVLNGEYLLTVQLADRTVLQLKNTHAETFKNVVAYASDPWHHAAPIKIRNLVYNNFYDGN